MEDNFKIIIVNEPKLVLLGKVVKETSDKIFMENALVWDNEYYEKMDGFCHVSKSSIDTIIDWKHDIEDDLILLSNNSSDK